MRIICLLVIFAGACSSESTGGGLVDAPVALDLDARGGATDSGTVDANALMADALIDQFDGPQMGGPDAALLDARVDAPSDAPPSDAARDAAAPSPDAPPPAGRLKTSWIMMLDGKPASCAAVEVTTVLIRAQLQTGGPAALFRFPCSDGAGMASLPPGRYDLDIRLLDAADYVALQVFVRDAVIANDTTTNLGQLQFSLITPTGGRFAADWALTSAGQAATCTEVGAKFVQLDAITADRTITRFVRFDCELGRVLAPAMPTGDYRVLLWLLDAAKQPLAGIDLGTKHLATDTTTALPSAPFQLPKNGGRIGASWAVRTNGAPSSCAEIALRVELSAKPRAGGTTITNDFSCSVGSVVGPLLAIGAYDVTLRLLDWNDEELDRHTFAEPVTITTNTTSTLDLVTFDF